MKYYQKTYDNLTTNPSDKAMAKLGCIDSSLDELALRFRKFYREAHLILFDMIVKQVWLEGRLTYGGVRRKREGNGIQSDKTYSFFLKTRVGISQKTLTIGHVFSIVPTYFKDFFPNFSDHDPEKEPEYFKYPYKYITLDHLYFVYRLPERLEMLAKAEKECMNIFDFTNWVTNYVKNCNDELGKEVYSIRSAQRNTYITKD